MKIQRLFAPLLVIAPLIAAPAQAKDCADKQGEKPHCAPTGLVTIEARKPAPGALPDVSFTDPVWDFSPHWLRVVRPPRLQPEKTSLGVGFVARADGLVATSTDLVEGATSVTVALDDGRRVNGEVVAVHTASRTALLRIESAGLSALRLHAASELRQGERLSLQTCTKQKATEQQRNNTLGFYVGRARGGERDAAILAVFPGAVSTQPGATLTTQCGKVVGLNAQSMALPMPLGGTLHLVHATPVHAVKRLVAKVPLREFPMPLGDWRWDFLFPDSPLFPALED